MKGRWKCKNGDNTARRWGERQKVRKGRRVRRKRGRKVRESVVGNEEEEDDDDEEMAAHHGVFDLEKEVHYLYLLLVPRPEPNVLCTQIYNIIENNKLIFIGVAYIYLYLIYIIIHVPVHVI